MACWSSSPVMEGSDSLADAKIKVKIILDNLHRIGYTPSMKTYTHKPLATAREKLGFTLEDVIRRLYAEHQIEIASKTILNWENGITHPDADILPKLVAVLKIKVEDLYEVMD